MKIIWFLVSGAACIGWIALCAARDWTGWVLLPPALELAGQYVLHGLGRLDQQTLQRGNGTCLLRFAVCMLCVLLLPLSRIFEMPQEWITTQSFSFVLLGLPAAIVGVALIRRANSIDA